MKQAIITQKMSKQKKEKKTVKKEKKSASKYQNLRINNFKEKTIWTIYIFYLLIFLQDFLKC